MPDYRYELRRGDEVIATGHFSREQPLEVGERITIGSRGDPCHHVLERLWRTRFGCECCEPNALGCVDDVRLE